MCGIMLALTARHDLMFAKCRENGDGKMEILVTWTQECMGKHYVGLDQNQERQKSTIDEPVDKPLKSIAGHYMM